MNSTRTFLICLCLITAGAWLAFPATAQPSTRQALIGHVPAGLSRLTAAGHLPATNRLQLSIGLPLRNTNDLAALLAEIYDPASPQYRHYLAREEFTQRFGPTEADYNSVIAFARTNGFEVKSTFSNRMLVDVEGSVADVEKTFHVTMRTYPHPHERRNFFASDAEPSLDLATPISHISGLDNYVIPRPFNHERPLASRTSADTPMSGSGPSGNYAGNDFRAAYVPGVTLTGTGQSVALVEFGGYYGADITNYENTYSLPHVPLVNVLLNGVNLTNNTGAEEALDIEMAVSMAPGLSQVMIYYGSSGDSVLNQIASDNIAKQIGASWGYGSDSDSTMIQDFQEFAAQGQSYFNASGDSDADVGSPFSPSDPPYVTSVGGTTLTTTGPGGSWVSESVWNWGGGTGGSGGVSTTFSMPAWQQGIDMTACQGSTTMRNIPDVALTANNIWVIYNNGSSGSFGGTSCATPLWAALIALVNQQATANNYPTVGFINPAVYALGKGANYGPAFHDIVTGNNTSPASPSKFYAVAGYDLCTGWGTPGGQNLINALATPGPSRAAAITWSTPATISGDTDVCAWGTALYACDWNNVNQIVNGVSFTGSSSTSSGGANIGLSGVTGGNYTAFTSTSNPYNGLSAAYKNILAGGDWSSSTTTLIVTLEDLIAGHLYAAQVWGEDARSTGNGRSETAYGNSGGNTVTLDYNSSNAAGGVGQYSIGVFTADGTNDSFTLRGNASTQINALQVRDVTACPWNYWGGYVNGTWDTTTTNWGNGQPFSFTSASFSSVNFADTNFYGATVANNLISLPSAGVSLGAVNFLNQSVNYTLQNAAGTTGITGSTAVNVSGVGSVTFASTNTYTGTTTVNSGMLALGGGGSIASSSQLVLNGGTFNVSALGNFTASGSQPITLGGGVLMASSLTLNGAVFTNTIVNPAAPWIVASNLIYGAAASTITLPSLLGFASYPVQFRLIQNTLGTSGSFNFNPLKLAAGYAGYLSNNVANNSIDLVLTSGGGPMVPLVWEGNVNGNWDILTTSNWANSTNLASAQPFENTGSVLFNDSATGTTNVALQSTLLPASVTVSNNALNYAFSGGQLTGPMTLTKSGSGRLTVGSANTYTGGTIITSGTLQLNAATAAGSGTIADGGNLNVNIGGSSLASAITGAGNLNVLETSGAQTTLSGSLAGFTGALNIPASIDSSKTAITSTSVNLNSAATINITSGGALFLSGESVPAPINVSGNGNSENLGALRLDSGASASGAITLQGNTAFGSYANAGMVTGAISDGGHGYSLLLEGSGALIFFKTNTYGGGTILKSTTVALRSGSALGSGLLTVTNSSTLEGNGNTLANPVTIASGQTLTLYSSVTLNGSFTGSGTLSSGGYSATYTLGGISPDFAGAINLGTSSGSTLTIPSGAALATSGALNNSSSATITVNGGLSVGTASIAVNATTTLSGSGTFTNGGFAVANNSSVNSSLNQVDTGYFYLGNASSQSGSITQTVATVNLNTTVADNIRFGHWPSETSAYLLAGGTLNATNIDTVVGWDGNGIVTVSGGTANLTGIRMGDTAANGNHNGNGTVTLTGGTLNIGADGISAGGTGTHTFTLGGGKVGALAAWSSFVSMSLTNSTGVLFDTTGGNISLNGALSGTGALNKVGTNTLALAGANTYAGSTTASNGTLLVNGSLGTNTVTIADSATLAGIGTVNGATKVQSGGTLAPGNSSIGTLTFGSSLNLNSGSKTLMELSVTNAVTTNDLISVAGTLTLGGTLAVTNLGTNALAAGNSFNLFNAGTFTGNFSGKTLPALATNLVWDTSRLTNNGVLTVAALPAITNQPQSLTVTAGNPASFTVGATGTGTLAYQWLKNDIPIAGATTNPFTIASATTNAAANYSVIVTNNYGAVTSALAPLTVNVKPAIFTPPQSVTVYVNSNATFSVGAGGTPTPTFQWQFNGTNVAGAMATNFTVTSAQTTNEGNYTVFISSAAGSITSSPVNLSLYREFGCAPAPYPSLLASNGARHLIVPGDQLGPTNLASTDARTNTAGEDGVIIATTLQAGQAANVQVVASAAGCLNAWIDFNTNGAWSDAGEQVFTNVALMAGTNTLAFNVPVTAVATSNTWARFRFSSATNLSFTGQAPDGEVEDYPLALNGLTLTYLAGANGTISGVATQTVSFTGSGSKVTAVPANGYYFANWSDGVTANPRTDADVTNSIVVTANFAVNTYTLTYLAGANGTISGLATQTVAYAGNGSPVTAVAAGGYAFTNWSDGLTANPRTDTGVTNNLTVTANFVSAVLTPPVLAANPGLTANGLQLIFSGPGGQTFKVLGSTNLEMPVSAWTVLTNGTFGAGPASYLDNGLTNPASFYLIVSP